MKISLETCSYLIFFLTRLSGIDAVVQRACKMQEISCKHARGVDTYRGTFKHPQANFEQSRRAVVVIIRAVGNCGLTGKG